MCKKFGLLYFVQLRQGNIHRFVQKPEVQKNTQPYGFEYRSKNLCFSYTYFHQDVYLSYCNVLSFNRVTLSLLFTRAPITFVSHLPIHFKPMIPFPKEAHFQLEWKSQNLLNGLKGKQAIQYSNNWTSWYKFHFPFLQDFGNLSSFHPAKLPKVYPHCFMNIIEPIVNSLFVVMRNFHCLKFLSNHFVLTFHKEVLDRVVYSNYANSFQLYHIVFLQILPTSPTV